MAKICPNCETENPSAFQFCGKCGFQLVEEEQLSEEDKLRKQLAEQKEQLELLKRNKKLEEEKLKKELLEKEKKLKETPKITVVPPVSKPTYTPTPAPKPNNSDKKLLIVLLSVIAVLVFGGFLFFAVIQPALIDKNAERYYTFVNSINFRSSKDAGGDYNKIGSVPYGGELITYEHDFDWTYAKYDGKKGYVSSDFVLNKEDFVLVNSIFGDTESKGCVSTAKCRRALLNYFKEKGYIGQISSDVLAETLPHFSPSNSNQWQIFCRDVKVKPNNVFYPKLYNKNSKFTDFAVIIKNINTNERRLLIFYFDDDETPHLYYEEPVYSQGYIVSIKYEYSYSAEKYQINIKYSD
jgi:molybdopterin converting factor small subunit